MNSEYAGLVPLLLIPILLLRRRTPQVWFFVGLGVLTLLYALAANTPLFHLFYRIPGVSLFRSWSIIIFLYGLSVATLGALGVQYLQELLMRGRAEDERAAVRRILWVLAAGAGLFALLESAGVITGAWQSLFGDAIRADRLQANADYIKLGFWIAFGLTLAVAGVWELAARGQLSAQLCLVLLSLWAGLDLYRAGRPFIVNTSLMNRQVETSTLFRPDDAIAALQQRRDAGEVFRVVDLAPLLGAQSPYGQNDLAVHGLEQLAGHHGNEIGRYRNLIGGEQALNLASSQLRLADVTNTAYMLLPGRVDDARFEEVYAGTSTIVYRNRNALPRAYLVGSAEIVVDDAAIERLLAPDFDARNTVLLSEPLPAGVAMEAGARGSVEWQERQFDRHTLRVVADRPALLVVLDNYYPAWRARVDGNDVPVWRANHTFRAVAVPAGEHTVTFQYEAATLARGATISLGVLALLLVLVAFGAVAERRARRSNG